MKQWLNIAYLMGWIMYLAIFIAKKNHIELPYFFQCYFTDLLAIPLVLGATNFILKKYTSNPQHRLSVVKVLAACIYFSVLFEWILPAYSTQYTADTLDVVCYFIGGGMYFHSANFVSSNPLKDATTVR
jgi:uncharacterized membrane protein AbrB (regulator of aidB expression)